MYMIQNSRHLNESMLYSKNLKSISRLLISIGGMCMLMLIGALSVVATIIFLGLFIWSLICLSVDEWKELILLAIISIVCIGTVLFVDSLLYEEVTVNEYEVVHVGESTFSHKTEDGGIYDKPKLNCTVYKSEDDRAYAVETVTTVESKINKALHLFITFSERIDDQEVTYRIYLPEEKYQEYISR